MLTFKYGVHNEIVKKNIYWDNLRKPCNNHYNTQSLKSMDWMLVNSAWPKASRLVMQSCHWILCKERRVWMWKFQLLNVCSIRSMIYSHREGLGEPLPCILSTFSLGEWVNILFWSLPSAWLVLLKLELISLFKEPSWELMLLFARWVPFIMILGAVGLVLGTGWWRTLVLLRLTVRPNSFEASKKMVSHHVGLVVDHKYTVTSKKGFLKKEVMAPFFFLALSHQRSKREPSRQYQISNTPFCRSQTAWEENIQQHSSSFCQ